MDPSSYLFFSCFFPYGGVLFPRASAWRGMWGILIGLPPLAQGSRLAQRHGAGENSRNLKIASLRAQLQELEERSMLDSETTPHRLHTRGRKYQHIASVSQDGSVSESGDVGYPGPSREKSTTHAESQVQQCHFRPAFCCLLFLIGVALPHCRGWFPELEKAVEGESVLALVSLSCFLTLLDADVKRTCPSSS